MAEKYEEDCQVHLTGIGWMAIDLTILVLNGRVERAESMERAEVD